MRKHFQIGFVFVVMAVLLSGVATAGPLTPPAGPVAETGPTMILSLPFTISQPGSYIVARDLTGVTAQNGITISTSGVTLDLGGFTLHGVAGSLDGITMTNFYENVVIQNGAVRNWSGDGVKARIDVGRIERISAAINGGWGISNALSTFSSHIVSCEVFQNGSGGMGGGIRTGNNAVVTNCVARSNTGVGVSGGKNVTIENTVSTVNRGSGFLLGFGAVVHGCIASFNMVPLPIQAPPSSRPDFLNRDKRQLRSATPGAQAPSAPRTNFVDPFANYVDPVVINERTGAVIPGLVSYGAGTEGVLTGSDGFRLGAGSTIEGCSAVSNADDGIAVGLGSTVVNCTTSNNAGNGVTADDDTTVRGSTSRGNGLAGIIVDFGGVVRDCTANHNIGDGIVANGRGIIFGNNAISNSGNGIIVTSYGCRVDSNHIELNVGAGIQLNNAGATLVVRNHFAGISLTSANAAMTDLIGPMNDLTNPWANFQN